MKTKDCPDVEEKSASPADPAEDPDPPSSALAAPVSGRPIVPSRPPQPSESLHDPYRIRGAALRRSLYFTLMALIPGSFWQGAAGGAPLIELAQHLRASDLVFSLLMAAPLASVLLQIPGSMVTEWLGRRKHFYVWTTTTHRGIYIVMGLLPWILPVNVAWPAMALVGLMFLSMSLANLGGPAWTNWMADLVPARVQGKFFASRNRKGIVVLCAAGLGVAAIMDLCQQAWFDAWLAPVSRWAGMPPLIFLISLVFMAAGVMGMLGILCFTRVDEPPMREVPAEPWLGRLMRPLKDSTFRRFVAYWSVWTAANSFCGWMWWLYLLDFMQAEKAHGNHAWWENHIYLAGTLILGVGFQAGQFLGYPMWGRAVDRFGRKPVLFISSTVHTAGWIWWLFLSPALLPWLFVTQMFSGFMYGGQDIASFSMMLQFNRRGGPAYQAVGAVIFSVVGALAALLAGVLATTLKDVTWVFWEGTRYEHTFNRYAVLIVIGVAIKYLGDFVFLPAVHDVGGKRRTHTLRFVLDNTYGSLNALIFAPLRAGAGIAGRGLDGVRETITDVASEGIRKWWK